MDITLFEGPAGEFGRGLFYQQLEKALEMGTFLHRGPVKNHGGGGGWVVCSYENLIAEGEPWKWNISLYGPSVKET